MSKKYNTKAQYFTDKLKNKLSDITHYPLTIMEAPCGYGKTTAAEEFLNKLDAKVLWMVLDNNSTSDFWIKFCHSLSDIDKDIVLKTKDMDIPKDKISLEEFFILFRNINFSEETILVIDNFQLVQNKIINNFIISIGEKLLKNVHIVILTQNHSLENILDMILKKQLNHITKSYFELDVSEIQKYYMLCGIYLNENESTNLYKYCGGWISVLYLQMLDYIENKRFQSTDNIYFLVEKIMNDKFSEKAKTNFLKLCFCEDFTVEKLKFILESTDVSDFISEIHDVNIFIKYDVDKKVYCIQTILIDYLQKSFEKFDTNFQNKIILKIGEWYQHNNHHLQAMLIFYRIKNFESIFSMNIRADDITKDMKEKDKDIILEIVQTCPNEIKKKYSKNLIVFALILSQYKEWNYLELLKKEIADNIKDSEILSEKEKTSLMGELTFLSVFTAYNDIEVMSKESKKAYEMLGGQTKLINIRESWTCGSPSVLYMFYRKSGTLDKELKTMNEGISYYYKLTDNHGYGAEAVMKAEILLNRGDCKGAEILCYKAIYMSESKKQHSIYLCAKFVMLRIAIIDGNFIKFKSILKTLKEKIKSYDLNRAIDLCEGFIFSNIGQMELIPKWLSSGDIEKEGLSFLTVSYANIIYGKTLFLKGEYLKLLGISQQFLEVASTFPNIYSYVYTYIYMAAARLKLGEKEMAIESLKSALEIAIPDRIYMPFVENGEYILAILKEIRQGELYKNEIQDILKLYNDYKNGIEKIRTSNQLNKIPQMTERELEVAKLAAKSLTNKEIGEQLYISQNTVKFYLKSIFNKLSITSRSKLKTYFIQ
ncbi:LuxR C-terminal-related transcriptional regulator [Clostridium sp. YIM B02555]|uniref:LuxR C-terminal-related transcriptional regulator n=1 Tax=Clostridium sp. YIM B02555 TaxID=2911968 RepID=UPI001EEE8F73|nr:LuxR C-terminal-related transcriptional regulator [Clostridium sp. YIM B02555]